MFGFLNIYKPRGKTSHDVVAVLRRITKIKQIGHTGTLDPFAEGVLPICIGKATRLIEYLDDDKAYIATIQLGKSTTTYDIEGDIVNSSEKKTNLEDISSIIQNFQGEIEQLPPIYSAIKVKGKKLYEYARNGEEIEINPRKVVIKNIQILNFNNEKQILEIYVECSKGTYIRSIANDLGENLGVFGHLIKLIRVKAGSFNIENSIRLEHLENLNIVETNLINPIEHLNYIKYELTDLELERVSHGMSIPTTLKDGLVILTYSTNIVAIGKVYSGLIKCEKVFI